MKTDEETVKNKTFPCPFCGNTMVYEGSDRTESWPPGTWGYDYSFVHDFEKDKSWDEVRMEISNPCEFSADIFIPDEVEEDE